MLKVYNTQMTLNRSKNQPQQQHKEEKSQDFKTLFMKMYKGGDANVEIVRASDQGSEDDREV